MTLPSERTRIMRDGLTTTAEHLLAVLKTKGGRMKGKEIDFMRSIQGRFPEDGRPSHKEVHHALRYLAIAGRINVRWRMSGIDIELNREHPQ